MILCENIFLVENCHIGNFFPERFVKSIEGCDVREIDQRSEKECARFAVSM